VTDVWVTIAVLAAGTVAIKTAGPVALGGRELPPRLNGVIVRLAPALLAALVVVETFGRDHALGVDESAAGLLAAAAALAARLPMIVAVVLAAVVTAFLRAV
jgi:branched chain amino acid efflux pump